MATAAIESTDADGNALGGIRHPLLTAPSCLRTIATLVFLLSELAGGLFGFTALLPYIAVLGVSVMAGFIVQGNFSNLTSGVLAVAAPRYLGATIGLSPASALAPASSAHSYSASRSTNSAGRHSSPPGR